MKKISLFNQFAALSLAILQISAVAAPRAFAGDSSDESPELVLLDSMLALEGKGLSNDAFQKAADPIVAEYESKADHEGRPERMAAAAIRMNIMTPARADSLKQAVEAKLAQELAANPELGESEQQALVAPIVLNEFKKHPANGAKFSSCTLLALSGTAVLGAAIYTSVYASTFTHDSSSVSATSTETASVGTSSGSSSGTETITHNSSSYTDNPTQKKLLITTSVIMYGVSATLYIMSLVRSSNHYSC